MKTLLLDGDIVAYKAAFAAERSIQWDEADEGSWTLTADLADAKRHASELISELQDQVSATSVVIALTHSENWRKVLYPAYKAQRKNVRKPVLLKAMRQFFVEAYETFERPTLEADDVLGILATGRIVNGPKIIASIDKDLLQIPGQHLNIDKRTVTVISERDGTLRHLLQTLTGDAVDNYPGLPGCGEVRAGRLLDNADRMCAEANAGRPATVTEYWPVIVEAYIKKGLTADDALTQARIARICRATDYDFTSKSVRLWNPPGA